MSQQMMAVSPSTSDEARGMSDEEELRRFAATYQETVGLGEELVDMSDEMRELGIEIP